MPEPCHSLPKEEGRENCRGCERAGQESPLSQTPAQKENPIVGNPGIIREPNCRGSRSVSYGFVCPGMLIDSSEAICSKL